MTSPTTTTGWNATAGSKSTDHFQGIDAAKTNRTLARNEYYRNHYDVMTGLRIAGTLGSFFILVLLTLLYKSRCKKHSRVPSQISMDLGVVGGGGAGLPRLSIANPSHLQHHPRDYGMMVGGEENILRRGYDNEPISMSQMKFLNCQRFTKPQLRLTPAHSESSEDGLSNLGRYEFTTDEGVEDEYLTGVLIDSTNRYETRGNNHNYNPGGSAILTKRQLSQNPLQQQQLLSSSPKIKTRMKRLEQNIDIHVILPTPTISPSSSETFTRLCKKNNDKELLLYNRSGSSGSNGPSSLDDSVSINESESEMSALVPSTSSALCYLDNLKYMDDTSSENIPTRGSDLDDQDQDNDSRRSIRSDSIFACYDPEYGPEISFRPPPPPPPPPNQTPPLPPKPSKSRFKRIFGSTPSHHFGHGGGGSGVGKATRRFSASSRKNSLLLRNDDEEECECRMTLTKAQVHHRDSYCGSELEYVNDYLESHRRRSSSTQTTLSDLRQCLLSSYLSSSCSNASSQSQSNHSPANPHPGPYFNFNNIPHNPTGAPSTSLHVPNNTSFPSNATPPLATLSPLSPPSFSPAPSAQPTSSSSPPSNNNPLLLSVAPLNNFSQGRKRSYNSLRKTFSLQCDDTCK